MGVPGRGGKCRWDAGPGRDVGAGEEVEVSPLGEGRGVLHLWEHIWEQYLRSGIREDRKDKKKGKKERMV